MNPIIITKDGIVFCNGIVCNPIDSFLTDCYCKNCNLINLLNQLEDITREREFEFEYIRQSLSDNFSNKIKH